ncbi:MAG TPA: phospholipase D-like domain-containing protein [Terrimicrobiaceae bacterium]
MHRARKKGLFGGHIKAWLFALATFLVILAVVGLIWIRRDAVEYYLEHEFSVHDPEFFPSAHALADPLPIAGNKIELLHNGKMIFPAMLEAIRGARETVNFEAFLFHSGEVSAQFCDALAERARAGVRVRVLLDALGSKMDLKEGEVEKLKAAGCAFAYYHPLTSWRIDRLNRRTHRRVLVVDGRIGFTGGVGFSDEWQGDAEAPGHWREVHARLEGPIVGKLQAAFQEHWFKEVGETLSGRGEFPELTPAGNLRAQVVVSHSFSAAPLSLVQAVAFSAARKSIYITNAYCAPSPSQSRSLIAAVKRGVDVRLLLPGKHNDQPMTKAAGRTAYGDLLRGGVKIYEYQPTMIHTKTMVIDGIFSVLGSSNFDARSAQINEELDITVYDENFGQEMQGIFEQDLQRSKPYTLEDFEQRSLWDRFIEWVMLPFHSQV